MEEEDGSTVGTATLNSHTLTVYISSDGKRGKGLEAATKYIQCDRSNYKLRMGWVRSLETSSVSGNLHKRESNGTRNGSELREIKQ